MAIVFPFPKRPNYRIAPATKIQAAVRGFLARKNINKNRVTVVHQPNGNIQINIKPHIARTIAARRKANALTLRNKTRRNAQMALNLFRSQQ